MEAQGARPLSRAPSPPHDLLDRAFQGYGAAAFWIECSFETALARAQEGLGPEATIAAYRRIYLPAQEIHLARDDPRGAATACIASDPRLRGSVD